MCVMLLPAVQASGFFAAGPWGGSGTGGFGGIGAYALNDPVNLLDSSGLDGGYCDPDDGDANRGVSTDCWVNGDGLGTGSCDSDPILCYLPGPGGPGGYNGYPGGVVGAPRLGPPQLATLSQHTGFDNPMANAMFAANTAVNYATIGTTLYGAAFFSPGIAATVSLIQSSAELGAFGPAVGRTFWTGGIAAGIKAAGLAQENGGMTLEMTPVGEWLSAVAPIHSCYGGAASNAFASGAMVTYRWFKAISSVFRVSGLLWSPASSQRG